MFNHKKLKKLRGTKSIVDVMFEMRTQGVEVSYSAYWSYEHGMTVPDVNLVCEIAKYFKIPVTDLL